MVFGVGGEIAQGGHGLVDVSIDHGPLHAEVFGDELRRLVLEFDPLEDFELPEWDAVAEIFDEGGEQGTVEGFRFRPGLGREIGSGHTFAFTFGERFLVDGALLAQQISTTRALVSRRR
jgi:hypothetical protein